MKKCNRLLLSSAEVGLSVGSLSLATFYYTTGQYNKALQTCERVISRWKPWVLYRSLGGTWYPDSYEPYICGRGISVVEKAKTMFAVDVVIYPNVKTFYSADLQQDIETKAPFDTRIPPLLYTKFLLFLCHHKLGNIDSSLSVLKDLKVLVHDKAQGYDMYPIVINLLAICLDKIGDVRGAVEACLLSQSLKSENNGVNGLLDKLLRENY